MSNIPKILIVDDEPDLIEIMTFRLQEAGFDPFSAKSSFEALEILKKEKIDLVLTDIRMPGMDGIKLLGEIKSNNPIKPKVVVITGSVNISLEEIYDLGAEGILRKPIDYTQLLNIIRDSMRPEQDFSHSRSFERFSHQIKVDLIDPNSGNLIHMKTTNLGRGGLFLDCTESELFDVGSDVEYQLFYDYDKETFSLRGIGKIVWVRKDADNDCKRGMGLKFETHLSGNKNEFLWFLNQLKTSSYIPKK